VSGAGPVLGFAATAWASVAERYADICGHPFVRGLVAGDLPEEVFVRYLLDDAAYLVDFARCLSVLASRMPGADGVRDLARAAAGAVDAERELHRGFLLPRGLDPDGPRAPAPSPTCAAYTAFLAEQASRAPLEVGLAAVLPCFRVYAEVGRWIAAQPGADRAGHPYSAWIATYADDAFDAVVRQVEAHADAVAAGSPHGPAMLTAYARATDLEWAFWDQAWRGPGRAG
jgi:thiaminase/transcriptional activator TenA